MQAKAQRAGFCPPLVYGRASADVPFSRKRHLRHANVEQKHVAARVRLHGTASANRNSNRNSNSSSSSNRNSNSNSNSDSNSDGNSVNSGVPGYGQQDKDSKRIRWTDRVALQAQVGSAFETLQVILAALRNNKSWADVGLPGDTRRKDEGLEALYEFANFDVWSLRTEFFGRRLDLGQFERFKRVMVATPYDIFLTGDYVVLSEFRASEDKYFCRVKYTSPKRDDEVFRIQMSRVPTGNLKTWMIDSLIHDTTPSDSSS